MYEGEGSCSGRSLAVDSRNAYLANVVTQETDRGSTKCKWNFTVTDGQKVKVTLLDFAAADMQSVVDVTKCQIYAILYSGDYTEPQTICGLVRRQREIFSHVGKVHITIAIEYKPTDAKDFYFLLHVQSKFA